MVLEIFLAAYREEVGVSHAEAMNKMVITDLSSTGLAASSYTTEDNSLLSLYKIISTYAESNGLSNNANILKLYGQKEHLQERIIWRHMLILIQEPIEH